MVPSARTSPCSPEGNGETNRRTAPVVASSSAAGYPGASSGTSSDPIGTASAGAASSAKVRLAGVGSPAFGRTFSQTCVPGVTGNCTGLFSASTQPSLGRVALSL